MIESFLNKTVIRQRKKSGTGSAVEAWEDKDTNLRCAIAPVNPSDTMAFQNIYFQTKITHTMFCLVDENILLNDKIVDERVAEIPYKPAAEAIIGYKPATEAEIPYKPTRLNLYRGENDEYLIKKINKWGKFYQVYMSEIK